MILTGGNVDLDPMFAALAARWLGRPDGLDGGAIAT